MKKFKKIAAIIMATVTLAAMSINTCAAYVNGEPHYWFRELKSKYYMANNTLHYTDLEKWTNSYVFFNKVDKSLMEGNVVLSVDFYDPNSGEDYCDIPDSLIDGLMSKLHLKEEYSDKYICEGKYPMVVDSIHSPIDYVNVVLYTNRDVFKNVDVETVHIQYKNGYTRDKARLEVNCIIKGYKVLPGYVLTLEECNSSSPAIFTTKTYVNRMDDWRGTHTYGHFQFTNFPYNKYKGKSFDVKINGIKVGKIALDSNQCKITITEK